MSLGVVVALPEEARAVGRALGIYRIGRAAARGAERPPVHRISGSAAGEAVQLAWAGAGEYAASRAAAALLQAGARALLAVGFCGSLSPEIRPGDLLLATEIRTPEGTAWPADSRLLERMERARPLVPVFPAHPPALAGRFHEGALVTALRVVTTVREKRRLREETGAVAVDMESAAVARCAAEARVPVAAARAITDGFDEPLPLDFNRCIDSDGQFHLARLILLLARRPFAVGGLIRLGRHSARAGQALASFLALCLPDLANAHASVLSPP